MSSISQQNKNNLSIIKDMLKVNISDTLLLSILFEMGRYFDKQFTQDIQKTQKNIKRIFNQSERNLLRKYFYYQDNQVLSLLDITGFNKMIYTNEDVTKILSDCIERCKTYDSNKIVSSIKQRQFNIENHILVNNSEEWLKYYREKISKRYKYSSFFLNIDQSDYVLNNYSINQYYHIIASMYENLENYRNLFIVVKGPIKDKQHIDQTWKILYKLGIYCENFVKYNDRFRPFKQKESVEKLVQFLNDRFPDNNNNTLASDFYSYISTGFKFEDCFISNSQDTIVLSYKKIALDDSPVPCPSCMTTIQQGNSFPEMFLRSYECKNPKCPDRSKSGRGKRFDEFGVYRYFKLIENEECNQISYDLYEKWRRDIFADDNNLYEMLLKYYTWGGETICIYPNCPKAEMYNRNLLSWNGENKSTVNFYKDYESLPIVVLMNSIIKLLNRQTGNRLLSTQLHVFNEDSSKGIRDLQAEQVCCAITSPPYYNAREYSQWPTLLMYLIDMMINGAAVFDTLQNNGFYLYNIGDIVNSDNIYVESNMSKRRLQLGFLSCMFFEMVGFNLVGNIIWDKGQVQSKRNSTVNLNSGYIKCINCYEHVFVLKKGNAISDEQLSTVRCFSPVIKINSKGINTYKHTAPYPFEMVDLLQPYITEDNDKYVLDPFLGSGTTVLWCKNHNYKGVGFEMNTEYYKLCNERIFQSFDFDYANN